MITGLSSSISALLAFGKKVAVTANNVANIQSEGFKKSRTLLEERSHGGVDAQIETVNTPGVVITEEDARKGRWEKSFPTWNSKRRSQRRSWLRGAIRRTLKRLRPKTRCLGISSTRKAKPVPISN